MLTTHSRNLNPPLGSPSPSLERPTPANVQASSLADFGPANPPPLLTEGPRQRWPLRHAQLRSALFCHPTGGENNRLSERCLKPWTWTKPQSCRYGEFPKRYRQVVRKAGGRPKVDKSWPGWAKGWPDWAEVCQQLAMFEQHCPSWGKAWPIWTASGRKLAKSDQQLSMLVNVWPCPTSGRSGPNWSNFTKC